MIDAHAHVHDEAFDQDRDLVIERARLAGVEALITIGTDLIESQQAIAYAESSSFVWASAGIHPHVFCTHQDEREVSKLIEELKKIAQSSDKIVAIGECGLDYFSHDATQSITEQQKDTQKNGFLSQAALARELSLPMIIHTRPALGSMDAYEDMYALLQSFFSEQADLDQKYPPVILHCYMGDARMTEKFLGLSKVYFSFTGNITYKACAGSDTEQVIGMISVERLMVETDSPYLAPVPYRGKRNEPAYVTRVASSIAQTKKIPYTLFEEQLRKNMLEVFPNILDM
ncbi:MAG: TatD family hydrolase [Candidatus Moranbacteria bacterium]|jgi:TatD DNase family protein|nr:TatD family hydrolase [Candidatus Moranbacteria bacterium]MBP9801103.1 TatD family hydrolase [Candidatus Moranbacteria bacterium]